jgi:hypothetical protein
MAECESSIYLKSDNFSMIIISPPSDFGKKKTAPGVPEAVYTQPVPMIKIGT